MYAKFLIDVPSSRLDAKRAKGVGWGGVVKGRQCKGVGVCVCRVG